jgi:hypothetical protein
MLRRRLAALWNAAERVADRFLDQPQLVVALITAALLCACAGDGPGDAVQATARFTAPEECANCHPRQYAEWRGAMMTYATVSPVFNALEAVGNALSDGALAADGAQALFCQRCHTPIGVDLGEFPPFAAMAGRPSRDFAGAVARHGLSCDFCHQVAGADHAASPSGDGIANASFDLQPSHTKLGPIEDPIASPFHAAAPSAYLRSAEFCGSCHDVRLPGPDAVSGEPLLRLENLFTEWQQGPYATVLNPHGRVVTCQDCHMSAYPYAPPGTYLEDRAAEFPGAPLRRVSTHYFTGVDIALVDFPGQSDAGVDGHGLPVGQAQRRADLLAAACELEVHLPESVRGGDVLPIRVDVTNVGAGHNVPSGFSQERQVWLEVTVSDAEGAVVYQSGYLVDRAHPETGELEADGNLDDEDLENLSVAIDPATMEATIEEGPDFDRRPRENLGLVNFGNEFRRVLEGNSEEVFMPFLANHMDNGHSIPPLETETAPYDVRLPQELRGPLRVRTRLRFRAFPPRFLRALAQARPDLVDEALVDRNRIVEMAQHEDLVSVLSP